MNKCQVYFSLSKTQKEALAHAYIQLSTADHLVYDDFFGEHRLMQLFLQAPGPTTKNRCWQKI